MPYRQIVTVYDGTQEADELLDMAARIARGHRARLTILHLRLVPLKEPLRRYTHGVDADLDAQIAQSETVADRRGVKAASVVAYVRAFGPAIVAQARTCGADLLTLLVPDIDKMPADRALSQDVELILRRAACAVMLYRPARLG
jgi:nucleotide-binding universal stress UspA family protein